MAEKPTKLRFRPHLYKNDSIFEFTTDTLIFTEIELAMGWHNHLEIIRILEGEGEFNISGRTQRVRAGSFVIINPNQIHSAYSNIGRPLKYQSLKFTYSYFDSNVEDPTFITYIKPLMDGKAFLPNTILNTFPIHSHIMNLFDELEDNIQKKLFGYELLNKVLLYKLLFLFHDNKFVYHRSAEYIDRKTSDEIVKNTINYIHDHFDEDFNLDLLSSSLDTSKPHMCRVFKRLTGQTITEYQNNHRIQRACELLIDTNTQIIKIAFDLGYHNVTYFNLRFKQRTLMTPKEYRQIYKRS